MTNEAYHVSVEGEFVQPERVQELTERWFNLIRADAAEPCHFAVVGISGGAAYLCSTLPREVLRPLLIDALNDGVTWKGGSLPTH